MILWSNLAIKRYIYRNLAIISPFSIKIDLRVNSLENFMEKGLHSLLAF